MTARPIRAMLVLLAVFALIAAACGDDGGGGDDTADVGDETTTSSTTTSEAPADDDDTAEPPPEEIELFDSYEGVTAESIKVGVLVADLDELRELGLVDINQGDVELVWNTMVDAFNAAGGVLGREIEMVFTKYNPVFNASADEACTFLTEDEKVFIVLGGVGGPAIDSVLCFVDRNATMMIGGTHTPAHFPNRKAPWISLGMASERKYRATIELYQQEGLLEGNIGVYDDSSEADSLTKEVLLPILDDLGIEVTTYITSNIPQGDEVALQQQSEVFAERLAQDQIDTLLIVQSQIFFGIAHMREAGFEGTILTVDNGESLNGLGSADERDPSTYDGAWGPVGLTAEEAWELESTQECVATFNEAQPDIEVLPSYQVPDGEPAWVTPIVASCQLLEMFRLVAEGAGADLNPDTFEAAAEELGSFDLPARIYSSLGPDKWDVDNELRIGPFDSTLDENGRIDPISEVLDVTQLG